MISLPTAHTAKVNAIDSAQIPDSLQQLISEAIASAIGNGQFSTDIPLATNYVTYEAQLTAWLKSLGYFVDYTDQPDQQGNLEVRWG